MYGLTLKQQPVTSKGGRRTSGFKSSAYLATLSSKQDTVARANLISCLPDRLLAMHMPVQRQNLQLPVPLRGVGKTQARAPQGSIRQKHD